MGTKRRHDVDWEDAEGGKVASKTTLNSVDNLRDGKTRT